MLMTIDIKIYDGNKNVEVGTQNPPRKLQWIMHDLLWFWIFVSVNATQYCVQSSDP